MGCRDCGSGCSWSSLLHGSDGIQGYEINAPFQIWLFKSKYQVLFLKRTSPYGNRSVSSWQLERVRPDVRPTAPCLHFHFTTHLLAAAQQIAGGLINSLQKLLQLWFLGKEDWATATLATSFRKDFESRPLQVEKRFSLIARKLCTHQRSHSSKSVYWKANQRQYASISAQPRQLIINMHGRSYSHGSRCPESCSQLDQTLYVMTLKQKHDVNLMALIPLIRKCTSYSPYQRMQLTLEIKCCDATGVAQINSKL